MRPIRFLLLAVPLVLALAACSASAATDGGGVLSLPSDAAGANGADATPDVGDGASPSPSASIDPRDAMLAFARCMREHGVDMPDPQPGQGGGFTITVGGPNDPDAGPFAEADEACRDLLGKPGDGFTDSMQLTPEDQQKFLDYAECMRDHGIDFPDPAPVSGNGDGVRVGAVAIDPSDPAWAEATEACKDLLPGQFGAPSLSGPGSAPAGGDSGPKVNVVVP